MAEQQEVQPCVHLTDEQAAELRRLADRADDILEVLTSIERRNWLFSTAKTWALWAAAIITAWSLGWGGLQKLTALLAGAQA